MAANNRKIALAQIQGAQALLTDVNTLKTSYDANKVVTNIAGGAAGTYNANEFMVAVKQVIDDQLGGLAGGTEGSIDARILAAKEDLQGKIDTINNMPVKDRVRVTGSITPGGLLTFAQDIAVTVPGIDKTQAYALYYVDNRPMVNEYGETLTYDFLTGTTNGVPSRLDPSDVDATDGVDYVPVASAVDFKMFPVGSFTFGQLPADYLLDNNELNMVAYSSAIDAIVVELTQDENLIEAIKQLVGTETVQNQIKLITDALAARVSALETKVETLNGDATTAGSVAKSVKDAVDAETTARTTAEAAINKAISDEVIRATGVEDALSDAIAEVAGDVDALSTSVDNRFTAETQARVDADDVLQDNIDALATTVGNNKTAIEQALATETQARIDAVAAEAQARVDGISAEATARTQADTAITNTVEANRKAAVNSDADRQYDIAVINATKDVTDSYVAIASQTEFTLTAIPNADKISAIVNSLNYYEDVDFTVNRATRKVTWTFTAANDGFDIEAGMFVQFNYKTTNAVTAPTHI